MSKALPLIIGSPVVFLYDGAGNLLFDTGISILELGLIRFRYEAVDDGEDLCVIEVAANSVKGISRVAFYRYQVIHVKWGYMGTDRWATAVLWVRHVTRKYGQDSITIELNLTDTYALLMEDKDPSIATADNMMSLLKDMKAVVQVEGNHGDPSTFAQTPLVMGNNDQSWKELTDGLLDGPKSYPLPEISGYHVRSYSAAAEDQDRIDDAYHNRLQSYYEDQAKARANRTYYSIVIADLIPFWSMKLTREYITDPLGITSAYKRKEALSEYKFNNQLAKQKADQEKADLQLKKELNEEQAIEELNALLGFSKDSTASGEGKNKLAAVKDLVSKAPNGPFNITGKNGAITIRNKSFSLLYRTYRYNDESGDLLDFTYNSDSQYTDTEESGVDLFRVNPETGAVELKSVADESANYVVVDTPMEAQEFRNKQMAKAYYLKIIHKILERNMALGKTSLTVEDMEGILGSFSAPLTTRNAGYYSPTGKLSIGIENTAVDLAGNYPARFFFGDSSTGEPGILDEVESTIRNEMVALREKKNKVSMKFIGDPRLGDGITVTILGLSPQDSGNYYLTKVTHSIDANGYLCTAEGHRPEASEVKPKVVSAKASKKTIKKSIVKKKVPKPDPCIESAIREENSGIIKTIKP